LTGKGTRGNKGTSSERRDLKGKDLNLEMENPLSFRSKEAFPLETRIGCVILRGRAITPQGKGKKRVRRRRERK